MFPIGFGREPGDFTNDIRPGRKRLQIRRPGPGLFTTHVRFTKMIQHEHDLRNTARELGDIAQLFMANTNVKSETEFGQQVDTSHKVRQQTEFQISFALQIPPDTFHKRATCQLFQICANGFALFQWRVRDYTFEPRLGFCQT